MNKNESNVYLIMDEEFNRMCIDETIIQSDYIEI
jgi:PHD/YefM family antitoxin component YafN of YafNO toxin-antitoxin module